MTTSRLLELAQSTADEAPASALRATRELILDVLGVAIAGSRTVEGRLSLQAMRGLRRGGDVAVPGSADRFDLSAAALVTGTMAYSIGLTDTHSQSITHPGPSVVATALTVGAATGASDDDILRAILAGVEVIVRVGAVVNPSHRARGFHATATCNPFGTAVTASRLLGNDTEQHLWALGIAGSTAGGLYEFRREGAMLMALHGGLPAENGVLAASLAAEGYTGPTTVLEGPEGFFAGFADDIRPEMLLRPEPAGRTGVESLSLRPYNACRYAHSAIDALQRIGAEQGGLDAGSIESLVVATHRTAVEQESDPTTLVSARLSTAFNVALALVHGPRLDEVTADDLRDPAVLALLDRIQLVEDAELTALFPEVWGSRVVVTTASGDRLEKRVDVPKGEPDNPFTGVELVDKFLRLSSPVIGDPAARRIVDAALDGADGLSGLLALAR